jgi:2-dehydro-3-deoxyphosphogluconate aldolase/(4S)-4-hydroxy-2-oxoglutarate aldolase
LASASRVSQQIESSGLVAILRTQDSSELVHAATALRNGGITCIEVTMTTPGALEVIRQARAELGDEALIGVGTVLDADTAEAAIAAGAQFVVAPIVDLATIETSQRAGVPVMPGAFSPTEIVRAWRAGADFVKVFPTGSVGPSYLKDLRGPLPDIKLVPTGGIQLDNVGDFIRAGACAVGVGSALIQKPWIADRDWGAIEHAAEQWMDAVRAAREPRPAS